MSTFLRNALPLALLSVVAPPCSSSPPVIRSQDRWRSEATILEVDAGGRVHSYAHENRSEGQEGSLAETLEGVETHGTSEGGSRVHPVGLWWNPFRGIIRRRRRSTPKGDCWSSCKGKLATCSMCGANKVCCRKSFLGDPWQCAGGGCNGYHCCIEGRRHCEFGAWGKWSACSAKCGNGHKTRKRGIKVKEANGGHPCKGPTAEQAKCHEKPCPADCEYKPWQGWGKCSATCGGGKQHRKRTKVPAKHGGRLCRGAPQQARECGTMTCPVDCKWDDWGEWDTCSSSCDGGTQARTREIMAHAVGTGKVCGAMPASEDRHCNTHPCPVDCKFEEWQPWGQCSKTCGGGTQERTRRTIPARHGGKDCEGSLYGDRPCNEDPCPVDCKVEEWSDWGECDRTCDGGYRQRTRKIVPAMHGGKPCYEETDEASSCNRHSCPVVVKKASTSTSTTTTSTTNSSTATTTPKLATKSSSTSPVSRGACLRALGAALGMSLSLRALAAA